MDDEESFLEVTTHFLNKLGGFEIHNVTSASSALEAMESESFDAVISDYQMPDMDGIELLKALRSKGSEVPFILLTGKGREDVAIEALNQGADFYLQKGKDLRTQFHELANMVTQAVNSKRAYLELIASQGRFKELADRITDVFIGLANDLKVTYWNKAVAELTRIPPRDAVGKDLLSIVPELSGTRTLELIRMAQDTGKRQVSVMDTDVGGKARWLEVSVYPSEEGLSVFARDVTLRRKAQNELEASERQYKTVVESAPVGIVIIIGDKVAYANPAATALYDGEDGGLVGVSLKDLVHPDDLPSAVSRLKKVAETSTPSSPREMRFFTKNGRLLDMEVSSAPIMYRGGPAIQTMLVDITGRKHSETRLRRREEEMRTILDSVPAMISYRDTDGRFVQVNHSFERITGVAGNQCRGRTVKEVFPALAEQMTAGDDDVLRTGVPSLGVVSPYQSPTGVRWAKVDKMPYRDEAGQVAGVITIAGDVTELLDFEKRLERFKLLLDSLDDAIVFTDHQLVVESWSHSARDMYGWDETEVVGRNLFELLGTEPVGGDLPTLLRNLQRDGRAEFEAVERRKDGSAISTACRVVALRNGSGESAGYAAISRDSSALTEARTAHVESEVKFTRAFMASPLMLTITRLSDGRFIDANDTFLEAMGFAREEVIGRTPVEIGALEAEDRASILTSLRAERPLRSLLLPVRTKSGQQRLMEYSADIFELGGEEVLISMANDVTVRKNYEDALRTVNKKLNLLGSVTRHDALNQLGIIKGWLSATMEATDDASVRDLVSRANSAADALRSHLEFTAQYKRLGMKRPEWIRVGEVASRVAGEVIDQDVEVAVSLEGVELYADPMLENVFRNIFANSVIHGGEVTRISLSHEPRGDEMVIIYEDDGVGISDKDKGWIFQRGYGKNTGYGLYLSSEILSITGMTITETGTPGKGARFEITVPSTRHRIVG